MYIPYKKDTYPNIRQRPMPDIAYYITNTAQCQYLATHMEEKQTELETENK